MFASLSLIEDVNKCGFNPCENGAMCINDVTEYSCQCPDGYTGKNCSQGKESGTL